MRPGLLLFSMVENTNIHSETSSSYIWNLGKLDTMDVRQFTDDTNSETKIHTFCRQEKIC
jgi:hypothetical protein